MMKQMLTGFFIFVFMLTFSQWSIAGEQELDKYQLMNSGFEEAEEGRLSYWKLDGPEESILLDENVFFEGKHSLYFFIQHPSREEVRVFQEIEVEAGKRYDFGGIIKVSLDDGFAKMMVVFLDKRGDEIASYSLPKLIHNENWVQQSMWIKSPNGSDVVQIICLVKGSGKTWFDDIHFTTKLRGGY